MLKKQADLYLYVQAENGVLLASKRTLNRQNLNLSLPGVQVYVIRSYDLSTVFKPFENTFSLSGGLSPVSDLSAAGLAECRLQAAKISRLLMVKISLELMKTEVNRDFSVARLRKKNVPPAIFKKYFFFMRGERKVILRRINDFFAQFEQRLARQATEKGVYDTYVKLAENVKLGVYSSTNQERKNIRAG